jgi:hypothetical protein
LSAGRPIKALKERDFENRSRNLLASDARKPLEMIERKPREMRSRTASGEQKRGPRADSVDRPLARLPLWQIYRRAAARRKPRKKEVGGVKMSVPILKSLERNGSSDYRGCLWTTVDGCGRLWTSVGEGGMPKGTGAETIPAKTCGRGWAAERDALLSIIK